MNFYDLDEKFFAHYGTPRHSGRYPYGSGEDPNQRHVDFLSQVAALKKQGLSEVNIAKGLDINTAQLRARKSIAVNELKKADQSQAQRLKDKGMSTSAIGRQMNRPESSVRELLKPAAQQKADILQTTANFLRDQVDEKGYLDVGTGVEHYVGGVSTTQLKTAIALLREEGYTYHRIKVPQVGVPGQFTDTKVLAPKGVTFREVVTNPDKIKSIAGYSEDGGRSFLGIEKPVSVDLKRVEVRTKEQGGADKDGVIELRRNVDDISLGNSRYAQVRIAVDGTHYLKGMAMYADDLPKGVDIRFNTNKKSADIGSDKLKALKPIKDDEDNPFGATIRQKHYTDKDGNSKLSPINIVGYTDPSEKKFAGEEGGWAQWSKSLSSQVLSKQSTGLAQKQLDLAFKQKQNDYDEIMKLTNPAVRKRLLDSFASDADSSSVHLKAAALPRQATHVILPMNSMKETEIYAPNYRNGEKVVLIRYPHGGRFEIPELTVNNKAPEPNRLIKGAKDAVGINSKVASRLSGADFDGDTVLVIPNNQKTIKNENKLQGLKDFDPQTAYPGYEGMKPMSPFTKQLKMGDVSNLITDMTLKGAPNSEIVRAVRHSMVVIDAEKHKLNWKQSAKDNGIAELKAKYQGKSDAGSATLISRASSRQDVNERKARAASEGGPIDPATGKKVYTYSGAGYTRPAVRKVSANGRITEVPERFVPNTFRSTKMAETDDAFSLVSKDPTVMETIYAQHANKLKALANEARKSYLQTPSVKYDPQANKVYAPQVASLRAKLALAQRNAPLERQAQVIANTIVKSKIQATPGMDPADLKKIKGQALTEARSRMNAKKQRIDITPDEWNAIQSGAITNNFLTSILRNTDLDRVKELATPRTNKGLSDAQIALAQARYKSGYTQAEIADSLGVSTSTLNAALDGRS